MFAHPIYISLSQLSWVISPSFSSCKCFPSCLWVFSSSPHLGQHHLTGPTQVSLSELEMMPQPLSISEAAVRQIPSREGSPMAGESLAHLQTAVATHRKSPEQDQGLQPEQCMGLSPEEDHCLLCRAQPHCSCMGSSGHTRHT